MKTTCIAHPPNHPLIIIRQWQVEFCGGNLCAAALLSYFEYWHNIRLEQREKSKRENEIAEDHGEQGTQNISLYQFHTEKELSDGMMGMYGVDMIRKAVDYLSDEKVGAVTVSKNPNPRYKFDNTKHFLFHPEVLNDWLSANKSTLTENRESSQKNPGPSPKNQGSSPKNRPTVSEVTSETTTEDSSFTEQRAEEPNPEKQNLALAKSVFKAAAAMFRARTKNKHFGRMTGERIVGQWTALVEKYGESKILELLDTWIADNDISWLRTLDAPIFPFLKVVDDLAEELAEAEKIRKRGNPRDETGFGFPLYKAPEH